MCVLLAQSLQNKRLVLLLGCFVATFHGCLTFIDLGQMDLLNLQWVENFGKLVFSIFNRFLVIDYV